MKKKPISIVEIKWKDSWTSSLRKWNAEDLRQEPDFISTSAGYLMHQDKRGINIAGEYRQEDKAGRHVQHIPAGMILSVKKLSGGFSK